MKKYLIFLLFLLSICFVYAEECPAVLNTPTKEKTFGELRVKAIRGWDKLLTWALSPQNPPFILHQPLESKHFNREGKSLEKFENNYGYFSVYHPIVGIVTPFKRDIKASTCLLTEIKEEGYPLEELHFTNHEILAKVLAYRPLKKGMKITIHMNKASQNTYTVDEVLDLWHGMPAFGLVPERKSGIAPILLFRGTDLDLTSEMGWASILSDLDTLGPGYFTYLKAQAHIHDWLKKMKDEYEPARAIGFSLGGGFVHYTMILESSLLSKTEESVSFNSPGVSKQMLSKWESLPEEEKTPHVTYINQGDVVSQLGYLLPNVWEITLKKPMNVIEAHVTLISAQPTFTLSRVNVPAENAKRK